jgi:hypothetical protein
VLVDEVAGAVDEDGALAGDFLEEETGAAEEGGSGASGDGDVDDDLGSEGGHEGSAGGEDGAIGEVPGDDFTGLIGAERDVFIGATAFEVVRREQDQDAESSLEHIRLRTGMYIGRIGNGATYDDGCYILLKEVIDNAVDEYIMGHGKEVRDQIDGPRVTVRDFGRGIPLGKVVDCVSKINTGAKYNDDVFQFSVGLNGVGTKAVNALSKEFLVRSHRDGEFVEARFKAGQAQARRRRARRKEPTAR